MRTCGRTLIGDGTTDALAAGFEELMWIDADVGFNPDAIDQLREQRLPVVCSIYPKKGQRSLAAHVLPDTDKIVFGEGGGFMSCSTAQPASCSPTQAPRSRR